MFGIVVFLLYVTHTCSFVQPKDSQHPDREEHVQVFIETWLTEEEYQDAKNQHRLAWQDDSPRPEPADKLSIDVTVRYLQFSSTF